jgi:hypothetical protein
MWSHLPPDQLHDHKAGEPKTGTRVAMLGTVSFTRSGFARVRWDDGRITDHWATELRIEEAPE